MRVSEAIRKGSKGKDQAFGEFINSAGAVCALGAAVLGVAPDTDDICFSYVVDELMATAMAEYRASEWDAVVEADCPASGFCIIEDGVTPEGVITHLNDNHRWSFEEIAAWLESIGL